MEITFKLNGADTTVSCQPEKLLLDVLREDLSLTGTKRSCGEGECGACTVLFDGRAVHACLTMIAQCAGHEIITIEGAAAVPELAVIQKAFVEQLAIQCGYCTPGMVMSVADLLSQNPDPSDEEIRLAISGNICRCSAYEQIVRAIRQAAQARREMAR